MKNLVEICNGHDDLNCSVDVDESFKTVDDINTFLLYGEDRLLAYIDMFAPKSTEAELTAFTLPEYRRKGFFKMLLKEAAAEVIKRGIREILFVCDRQSLDGQNVVHHLNALYEYSEYMMKYRKADLKKKTISQPFIRESEPEDIEQLVRLSLLSFDKSREDAENYINLVLTAKSRIQHVGLIDGQIAGMISTALEEGRSYIHGLCVFPDSRRQGIGAALLEYKVSEALVNHPDNDIVLEVLTENDDALSIYRRAGFETIACYDYFRIAAIDIGGTKNQS